jgi:hypothetical protein
MAAATLVAAQADAMTAAAQNPSGGGMLGAALFSAQAKPKLWGCACGASNTGNFCENCGRARP